MAAAPRERLLARLRAHRPDRGHGRNQAAGREHGLLPRPRTRQGSAPPEWRHAGRRMPQAFTSAGGCPRLPQAPARLGRSRACRATLASYAGRSTQAPATWRRCSCSSASHRPRRAARGTMGATPCAALSTSTAGPASRLTLSRRARAPSIDTSENAYFTQYTLR